MMMPTEEDRLIFNLILDEPEGRRQLGGAIALLDADILASKFNLDRARQVFLFAIDNCVHHHFKGLPGGATILFAKAIRQPFADDLAESFTHSRGNIENRRPTRRGLLSYILGKRKNLH